MKIDYLKEAEKAIKSRRRIVYTVAKECGFTFKKAKDQRWFLEEVAEALEHGVPSKRD